MFWRFPFSAIFRLASSIMLRCRYFCRSASFSPVFLFLLLRRFWVFWVCIPSSSLIYFCRLAVSMRDSSFTVGRSDCHPTPYSNTNSTTMLVLMAAVLQLCFSLATPKHYVTCILDACTILVWKRRSKRRSHWGEHGATDSVSQCQDTKILSFRGFEKDRYERRIGDIWVLCR